ncbi:hypothetical protein L6270_01075 [Candidatus Parcubacteria bacterium]|nr:hypothetical protein [Patescibacteria group bacterium]MBU4309738.1 hypothetical protein [Patescibacteria group bacterium]MBU4432560.1 hypothetical protein [Patescibacteria group bacterium]MBU4578077.1 hypothetical protein [Patescibacteria group bacterium]MCG2696615.1 hypothetical protein [Candidatus Parcubacteria bacterium]
MNTGIKTYGIFFVIGLLLIAFAADHTFFVLVSALTIIGSILFLATINVRFRMVFFVAVNEIVDNNNNIFYAVALSTVLLFIGGLYFGAGEPIFATSTRYVRDEIRAVYDDNLQQAVNEKLMRGKNLSDEQVADMKAILAASKRCESKKIKGLEDWNVYVEKLNNHLDFDCFATDDELNMFLAESNIVAKDAAKEKKKITTPSYFSKWLESTNRTWFWWKAFIVFLLVLCPLSFVVSFHDEVANGLTDLMENVKRFKESVTEETFKAGDEASNASRKKGSLLMTILSIDFFSEMFQVLIKALRS